MKPVAYPKELEFPCTLMLPEEAVAVELAVSVRVEEAAPPAATCTVEGLKLAVTPEGKPPDMNSETGPENPFTL